MSSGHDVRSQSIAQREWQIENNPCYYEQAKSLECLQINSDPDKCSRQFDNVKMCTTFWYEVTKFRKQHRILPHLPDSQERLAIRDRYMKSGSLKAVISHMKQEHNIK